MKIGVCQTCASDDPALNLTLTLGYLREAASLGADFILTPEVTNIVSLDRAHQEAVLRHEEDDLTLASLRAEAKALGVWLSIGSLALKTHDADGRFANRSFLVDPAGQIAARYDKMHMFDVVVSETEQYRESAGYRPGSRAVLAQTPFGNVGLTVCYDLRFAALYRALAAAGADLLLVPSAFSPVTGAAHWEPLLRARAIETGCFVIAAAQTGIHAAQGKSRKTYGHSMVVSPWGEVLLDAGTETGVHIVDIDPSDVAKARARIPSLRHGVEFEGP